MSTEAPSSIASLLACPSTPSERRPLVPHTTRAATVATMRGNRKVDTRPELALRSALHRLGLRYRKSARLELGEDRTVSVDVLFPRPRVAVFVDGCFWHSCPAHGRPPVANSRYWTWKLTRNLRRDREVDILLTAAGWRVVRVWEHEVPQSAALRVSAVVGRRSGDGPRHE